MSDRTVHALYSGMEIVRYDKAGKWFLEPTNKTLERQLVTVEGAANAAIWGWFKAVGEAQIFFGRHGGSTFDRLVREQLAERSDAFEMESSEGSEIVGELKARVTELEVENERLRELKERYVAQAVEDVHTLTVERDRLREERDEAIFQAQESDKAKQKNASEAQIVAFQALDLLRQDRWVEARGVLAREVDKWVS
jgi:regulator of replication initiation timing